MATARRAVERFFFDASEPRLLVPLPTPVNRSTQSSASNADLMDFYSTVPSSSAVYDNNANTVTEETGYATVLGERVEYHRGSKGSKEGGEPFYEDVEDGEGATGTDANENIVQQSSV
jgi:hypothetical protein